MIELNFPNAVLHDRDFYDRDYERRRIAAVLRAGTGKPVVILGERRIGKTSLLNVAVNALNAQPHHRVVFPGPWSSLARFKLEFLSALVGPRLRPASLDAASPVADFVGACAEACVAAPDRQVVVCIDEFDSLLLNCPPAERAEIQALIFHLIEKARLPIRLFFTMTRPTERIGQAYPTSFLDKSEQIPLDPFTCEAAADLALGLLGQQFSFAPEALDDLYGLSGGHPYFLKALLDTLANNPAVSPVGDEITRADVARAIRPTVERPEVRSTLQNLYVSHCTDSERGLLFQVSSAGGPLPLSALSEAGRLAARSLTQRGYLIPDPAGAAALRIGLIGDGLAGLAVLPASGEPVEPDEPATTGLVINALSQRVFLNDREIALTALELRLVLFMGQHLERVIHRDQLAESVWGRYDADIDNARIDQAIARIRRKLGDDARQQLYLQTRAGTGYLLRNARFVEAQA